MGLSYPARPFSFAIIGRRGQHTSPDSRCHPHHTLRAARTGGGEASRRGGERQSRAAPLPPGLSEDAAGPPQLSRPRRVAQPPARFGGQLHKLRKERSGPELRHRNILYMSLQDITASGLFHPEFLGKKWSSARLAPTVHLGGAKPLHPLKTAALFFLTAATRQPARAICTRATRSGCREYRERPLSSRATSSPVQSATPSATIASTGAT